MEDVVTLTIELIGLGLLAVILFTLGLLARQVDERVHTQGLLNHFNWPGFGVGSDW